MNAKVVGKLLSYMKSHGYMHAYPILSGREMEEKPTFNLKFRMRDARTGCVGEIEHSPPVERAPQLPARSIDHCFNRIEEWMVRLRARRQRALRLTLDAVDAV